MKSLVSVLILAVSLPAFGTDTLSYINQKCGRTLEARNTKTKVRQLLKKEKFFRHVSLSLNGNKSELRFIDGRERKYTSVQIQAPFIRNLRNGLLTATKSNSKEFLRQEIQVSGRQLIIKRSFPSTSKRDVVLTEIFACKTPVDARKRVTAHYKSLGKKVKSVLNEPSSATTKGFHFNSAACRMYTSKSSQSHLEGSLTATDEVRNISLYTSKRSTTLLMLNGENSDPLDSINLPMGLSGEVVLGAAGTRTFPASDSSMEKKETGKIEIGSDFISITRNRSITKITELGLDTVSAERKLVCTIPKKFAKEIRSHVDGYNQEIVDQTPVNYLRGNDTFQALR